MAQIGTQLEVIIDGVHRCGVVVREDPGNDQVFLYGWADEPNGNYLQPETTRCAEGGELGDDRVYVSIGT